MTLISSNGSYRDFKIDIGTKAVKHVINEENNLMLLRSREELDRYFINLTEKIKHRMSDEDRIEYENSDIFNVSYDEDDE